MAKRLAIVRSDYVGLVDEPSIVADRAREWMISRRQVRRYLAVVKARYGADRGAAEQEFHLRLISTVTDNMARARDAERRAREASEAAGLEPRDLAALLRAESAARDGELRGCERVSKMVGADAPVKSEVTQRAAVDYAKLSDAALEELAAQGVKPEGGT